jgi:hypothetical protein
VPDRPVITRAGKQGQWLIQQPGQALEVPRPVAAPFRLQLPWVPEPGDQVRIGVLIRPPRPARSARGALSAFLLVGFPEPPPEPGVPVSGHRALRKSLWVRVLIVWPAMGREWLFPGTGTSWW